MYIDTKLSVAKYLKNLLDIDFNNVTMVFDEILFGLTTLRQVTTMSSNKGVSSIQNWV